MPYFDVVFDAKLNASAGSVVTGDVLTLSSDGATYVRAVTANLITGHFPSAIVVESYPGDNTVIVQFSGNAPASVTGLAIGDGAYVRLNTTTARMERIVGTPVPTDWVIGKAFPSGTTLLTFNGVQGAAAGDSGGVSVVVDIREYGAVCDGVTDDSDAWDDALADVIPLGIDVIQVPKTSGGCAISRPIKLKSTDPNVLMNGVTIEGQLDTLAIAPAVTTLKWLGVIRSGTSASLVATANDVGGVDPINGFTWTYFLLSGCTGANFTPADVGTTKIRISGAATANLNCQALIERYVSATSVYVAIPNAGVTTDANNGTIDWVVLESIVELAGRGLTFRNLSITATTATGYAYNAVSFTHPDGPGNQLSVSRCEIANMVVSVSGGSLIENAVEIGGWIIPTKAGFAYTILDSVNNHYRPWSPTQADYVNLDNVVNNGDGVTYTGCCIRSANASSQSRTHTGKNLGVTYKEYVTRERSDFPNQNGTASCPMRLDTITAGVVTVALFERTSGQAQFIAKNLQIESAKAILIHRGLAGSAYIGTSIDGGYCALTTTGPAAVSSSGLFQLSDAAHVNVENLALDMNTLSLTGVFATCANVGRAVLNFRGCILPHWTTFGKKALRELFAMSEQYCIVNIKDCLIFKTGVGNVALGDTVLLGAGSTAAAPTSDERFGATMLVRGLSNSRYTANNFFGTVKISDTETRKTWAFADAEVDEDYSSHYYEVLPVLIATSGAASANSAIPLSIQKARRSCTLELTAAPGAGTSRTFGLQLIRQRDVPVTAFHPQDVANLYFYFDAEYDFRYNVDKTPELTDNSTGRLYWRNQASRRAAATANTSAYDVFPYSTSSFAENNAFMPPEPATDAGYNSKYVVLPTSGHWLRTYLGGNEACASPLTIFVVGQPGAGAVNKAAYHQYEGGGGVRATLYTDNTNTRLIVNGTAINAAHVWTGKEVVCAVVNGAASNIYISAITTSVTGVCGAIATGASDYCMLLNTVDTNMPWGGTTTGKLACVLVYKGALSVADRTSVMNWLGTRYNKAIGP